MTTISTARLLLRPAREDDLDAMHRVLSNAQAMRYWSTLPHRSLDETREWLDATISSRPEESFDFLVEYEGRVVGKAGLFRLPEIGFILHPDVWGRGLASEALGAVIPATFARYPLPEITADVDPRNAASLNVLKKQGFRETGRAEETWLIDGVWCDSVYLSLPRPEEGKP